MSDVLIRLGRPQPFEPDESEWGGPPKTIDERTVGLSAMWDERGAYRIPEIREAELDRELRPFRYTYDLGDCWEHEIVVLSSSEADVGDFRLVQGKGRVPLEGSGGVWRWDAIKDTFAALNPDPGQQDSIEWSRRIAQEGPDFDPATEPDFTSLNPDFLNSM
ncbi:hypothetical protein EWM64_g6339 [Hericium alpestre]|uniref:Plasmid pRiA4b Orf3-like domain-containing protein n=1 Tax=Hericium alpestre TaxID=135208 RepID=A0A4Y9ZUH1_9AGAM|nr:hypothetical protein EWM64_g6339 [Hericium alpestre]